MRKWLIGTLAAVVLLSLIGTYVFIPGNILITRELSAGINQAGAFRFLSDPVNWEKWWPRPTTGNQADSALVHDGFRFKLNNTGYNAIRITITQDQTVDTSVLNLVPIAPDTVHLVWNAALKTSHNPVTRFARYFKAKKLANTLETILGAMQSFLNDGRNIYGFDIKKEKVTVEYLVATEKIFPRYPDTDDIYGLIGNIKKYIASRKGTQTDFPMLNIRLSDSSRYLTQLGIPVDAELPSTNQFFSKRMLKNGDILVTEARGGRTICDSAMKKIEQFAADHRFLSVALPFHSLVTDRSKEKDSAKWITKVYYPIVD